MREFSAVAAADWYWLADDGRVFSSARFAVVGKDDAGLKAWSESGAEHRPDGEPWPPTAWPKDDAEAQTDDALNAVLIRHGLSMTGSVRSATSYDLIAALTDDEVKALSGAKAKDQHLFNKRTDPWPETNPKIARIADKLGMKPSAWFDRVFSPAS